MGLERRLRWQERKNVVDDEMDCKARTRQTVEAKDFKIYFKNNRKEHWTILIRDLRKAHASNSYWFLVFLFLI